MEYLRRTLKLTTVAANHPPVDLADVRVGPVNIGDRLLAELQAITGRSTSQRIPLHGSCTPAARVRRTSCGAAAATRSMPPTL
ncbi:hypothetical protein NHF46_08760 [Arthrobacter alpinus]|nr:hypothetical protein [Arthrobacter alpinus]